MKVMPSLSISRLVHFAAVVGCCLATARYNCASSDHFDVLVDIEASFLISYEMKNGQNSTGYIGLGQSENFICDITNSAREITIVFAPASQLSALRFSFYSKNGSAYLSSISVNYNMESSTFPNASNYGNHSATTSLNEYLSSDRKSYFCNSTRIITISEVRMNVTYLQVQAFGMQEKGFDQFELCTTNDTTTTNPSTTTTGSTITTSSKNTTSSSTASTTSSAPLTTMAPAHNRTIVVRDGDNNMCLLMVADIQLSFSFNKVQTYFNVSVNYPAHSEADGVTFTNGSCGNDSNWLKIFWFRKNDTVTLELVFDKDNSLYHLDTVVYQYFNESSKSDFSPSTLTESLFSSNTSGLNLLNASVDSYICQRNPLYISLNVKDTVAIQNFTVQAFMKANQTGFYGTDDGSCHGQQPTKLPPITTTVQSKTVAIAVSAALVTVVIIIIIVFIVIRVRSGSGYTTLA